MPSTDFDQARELSKRGYCGLEGSFELNLVIFSYSFRLLNTVLGYSK